MSRGGLELQQVDQETGDVAHTFLFPAASLTSVSPIPVLCDFCDSGGSKPLTFRALRPSDLTAAAASGGPGPGPGPVTLPDGAEFCKLLPLPLSISSRTEKRSQEVHECPSSDPEAPSYLLAISDGGLFILRLTQSETQTQTNNERADAQESEHMDMAPCVALVAHLIPAPSLASGGLLGGTKPPTPVRIVDACASDDEVFVLLASAASATGAASAAAVSGGADEEPLVARTALIRLSTRYNPQLSCAYTRTVQ